MIPGSVIPLHESLYSVCCLGSVTLDYVFAFSLGQGEG